MRDLGKVCRNRSDTAAGCNVKGSCVLVEACHNRPDAIVWDVVSREVPCS